MSGTTPRRILAVASGGGHWVQLLRLRPAFMGDDVAFVTVERRYRDDVGEARFYTVRDATRWNRLGLVLQALGMLWVMLRERPDVVVTTGAAPGYFAVLIGKVMGARTLWLDSLANAEALSMSGQHAARRADLCLTQWKHLAGRTNVRYRGSVL